MGVQTTKDMSRTKPSFTMRRPEEFNAAAEATLGDKLGQWRAEEEKERNPKPGQKMKDGTVCAGAHPETGENIFVPPQAERVQMDFNEVAQYIQRLNGENYFGHDDWTIPSPAELDVLYRNRKEGALAGAFQEKNNGRGSSFHWSAEPHDADNGCGQWFSSGLQVRGFKGLAASVRAVRRSGGELS